MADFGDIKDKSLLSGRGAELLRARQEKMENLSVKEVRIMEQISKYQTMIDKASQESQAAAARGDNEKFAEQIKNLSSLSARVDALKSMGATEETARIRGAEKMFKSGINTMLGASSTSSDISAASRATSTLGPALEMATSMPTSSLEQIVNKNKSLISRQNERIRDAAEDVETNPGLMKSRLGLREKLIGETAQAEAAMSAQRKLGLDIGSQYYKASEMTDRVKRSEESKDIKSDVAAGKYKSSKDVEEQLSSLAEKLLTTFEQFDTALKAGAENTDKLANDFKKVSHEYQKMEQVQKELEKQGAGGGGAGMMSMVGNLGTLAVAGSSIYRHAAITSELNQMRNATGFAAVQNERYTDIVSATKGDMGSLRRVITDQAAQEAKFGLMMGNREGHASLGGAAGQTARAGGAVASEFEGAGGLMNIVNRGIAGFEEGGPASTAINEVAAPLANASPEIIKAANDWVDYGKMIPQDQTALEARSTFKDLQDTINQINDSTAQQARDYTTGIGFGTRGLGGRREGAMSGLIDPAARKKLALQTGMTEQDIIQMTHAGTANLGTDFRGMADVQRAGTLASVGYLSSPEQYMQARGALANAGGKAGGGDFETILKNAVANGMDSSKQIMEMVQGVSSLAAKSAAAGIEAVGGTTQVMGRSLDALLETGMSKNLAASVAASSAAAAGDLTSNRGLTLQNVIQSAELRKSFPTMKPWEMTHAQALRPEMTAQLVQAFATGDEKEITRTRTSMGLTADSIKNIDDAKRLQAVVANKGIRALGIGRDTGIEASIQRKAATGEKLTEEEKAFATMPGETSGTGVLSALQYGRTTRQQDAQATATGKDVGSFEEQNKAGALTDAKIFSAGMDKFQTAMGGFEKLGATMMNVAEKLDPKKMADASKSAAEEKSFSGGTFDTKMQSFNTFVGDAAQAAKDFASAMRTAIADMTKPGYGSNTPAANPTNQANTRQPRPGGH